MTDNLVTYGYLFDSNIIIAFLADDEAVKELVNEAEVKNRYIYFSMISVCEIYSGSNDQEIEILDKLFVPERCLEVSLEVSREAGLLRRNVMRQNRKIKTPDAIIAATAKYHNLSLVTRDSDFRSCKECHVVLI